MLKGIFGIPKSKVHLDAQRKDNMAAKKITMRDEFIDGDNFTLANVPVKWASLLKPDTRFEPCYKVDLILTKDQAERMAAVGFKIRTDKDGDKVLRVKKKTMTKSGTPMEPPSCVGPDGETVFTERVGNGSVLNVSIFAKYIEVSGTTYLPAYLNGVQVVNHVPYKGAADFADVSDSGSGQPADVPF